MFPGFHPKLLKLFQFSYHYVCSRFSNMFPGSQVTRFLNCSNWPNFHCTVTAYCAPKLVFEAVHNICLNPARVVRISKGLGLLHLSRSREPPHLCWQVPMLNSQENYTLPQFSSHCLVVFVTSWICDKLNCCCFFKDFSQPPNEGNNAECANFLQVPFWVIFHSVQIFGTPCQLK